MTETLLVKPLHVLSTSKRQTSLPHEQKHTCRMLYHSLCAAHVCMGLIVCPCHTVEDQNFALFNYVNELNGDIELAQEQIQEVSVTYM